MELKDSDYERPVPIRIIVHLTFLTILLAGGIIGASEWRSRERNDNALHAMRALRTISSAQADFRFNDRDGNKVNDFWTWDVAGLHHLEGHGSAVRLIAQKLADADAAPRVGPCADPVPYHGYYFIALDWDDSVTPRELYAQDTDGKSGKTRNLRRFGYCAYPADPGVSGNAVYIINENNSLFRIRDFKGAVPKWWPGDDELRMRWSRGGC